MMKNRASVRHDSGLDQRECDQTYVPNILLFKALARERIAPEISNIGQTIGI
jgi:hypothetical protein